MSRFTRPTDRGDSSRRPMSSASSSLGVGSRRTTRVFCDRALTWIMRLRGGWGMRALTASAPQRISKGRWRESCTAPPAGCFAMARSMVAHCDRG
jgi:hypothetical protein